MIVGCCCCRSGISLVRGLLGLIVVLMRRDLSKDAELLVLQHENTVLRHQVARVHYTPADRCGWPPCPGLSGAAAGWRSSRWPLPRSWLGTADWSRASGTTPPAAGMDCDGDQEAGDSHGDGESHLGAPTGAGRLLDG